MTIAEHPPSVVEHMASRADARLQEIDRLLAREQAKITEAMSLLVENDTEKDKVLTLHKQLEAQRLTSQSDLKNAQLIFDLSTGSAAQEQKEADLLHAQENLALTEQTIAHDYEVSQQYEVDYQAAAKRFRFLLQIAQSELEQLQNERQALLAIRVDAFGKHGLEVRDAVLGELEELRIKEERFAKMAERAKQARIAKQLSIATRLAPWPSLALSTETQHGHHEVSVSTEILERWHSLALEMEANAGALSFDDILPQLLRFLSMKEIPVDPIRSYGPRSQFSHLPWDKKPGPISRYVSYMDSLESIIQQWREHDVKQSITRNLSRATQ